MQTDDRTAIEPRVGLTDLLADLVRQVSRLQPGQAIEISRRLLCDLGTSRLVGIFGPVWSPVDRIMENIVGSAYEIVCHEKPMNGNVVFERLREPLRDGRQTYVSPDRREWYRRDGDFWLRRV